MYLYTTLVLFITALFIIAQTWKQPRSPLADEWIRKLWYIHTMGYYSAIKRNAFESILMRWTIQISLRSPRAFDITLFISVIYSSNYIAGNTT